MRHYEDLEEGETHEFGTYEVTEAEIVEFAEAYDPQAMHLEQDVVEGGPIASGWHTCAMCMRLLVDGFLNDVATLASPGVDDLRWPTPVRPGDELSVSLELLEKRPSESDADRGVLAARIEGTNGDDVVVSMIATVLVARRVRADG